MIFIIGFTLIIVSFFIWMFKLDRDVDLKRLRHLLNFVGFMMLAASDVMDGREWFVVINTVCALIAAYAFRETL